MNFKLQVMRKIAHALQVDAYGIDKILNPLLRHNGKESGWMRGGGDYYHSTSSLSAYLLHRHFWNLNTIITYFIRLMTSTCGESRTSIPFTLRI